MSDSCTHDCSTCSSDCGDRSEAVKEPLHESASVGKVFAVAGGKGGVGRSTVAALLAVRLQKQGYQTAVLDADLTGPSVPFAFGLNGRATVDERGIFPAESENGTQIISVNLMIPNPADPVLARGALVENTIKKFWSEVIWEDVDFMFIDLPAGTGEIPIAVLRHLPVDGVIMVTSPSELSYMITGKSLKMAKALKIPVAAIVENMSGYACAECGAQQAIFGKSHLEALASQSGVPLTARLPLSHDISAAVDSGRVEELDISAFDELIDWLK